MTTPTNRPQFTDLLRQRMSQHAYALSGENWDFDNDRWNTRAFTPRCRVAREESPRGAAPTTRAYHPVKRALQL